MYGVLSNNKITSQAIVSKIRRILIKLLGKYYYSLMIF